MDTLDPQVVNLAKAIRQTESGGNFNAKGQSGEYGAYQFTNDTWNGASQKYGINVPLNKATPEQQNAVAYNQIKEWKDKGHNVAEIASMWNAGEGEPNAYTGRFSSGKPAVGTNKFGAKYSVPDYAYSVANAYQTLKKNGQVNADPNNPSSVANVQNQPPSVGGFIQNTFDSAGKVLGGLGNAVMHPIDTVTNLLSTAAGGIEKGTNALGITNINNQDTQNFDNLVSTYGQRYGGSSIGEVVHNIGHTLYTDPVGAALDLSVVLDGAGAALGKAGQISDVAKATELAKTKDFITTTNGILKSGDPAAIKALTTPGTMTKIADAVKTVADYTNPITPVVKGVVGATKLAGKAAMGIGSKIIGESPELITDLVKNYQDYSKASMEANSRGGLATEFGNAIDAIEEAKSTTGGGYDVIKNAGANVTVPADTIIQTFADNGLKVSKDVNGGWQIAGPTADTTLSSADVAHFKDFLDQFGSENLSAKQLLNARTKLSEYSNYEGKTNASTSLARNLRKTFDSLGKDQIPGLGKLDAEMAPQIQAWKGIKKEFLTKDASTGEWVLKPNTASKLANALKAGKEPLLAKLEEVLPGITRKIEVLKNIEEIENSLGIKVGAYTKSGLEVYGVATGNVPLAVGMIIAHPAIANQILRGFGFIGAKAVIPVLGRVRALLGVLPKGAIMQTAKVGTVSNEAKQTQPNRVLPTQ
jgi:hypothetical protein